MKNSIFFTALMMCSLITNAQNVNIPDNNFKTALLGNLQFNPNQDTEISYAEAAAATGQMDVSGLSISDLTGIEAFTGISMLFCEDNNLSSLDVSNNVSLTSLSAYNNQLNSIVLNNNSLESVSLSNNNISFINVSTSLNIVSLSLNDNPISMIDVTSNSLIELLGLSNTIVTEINLQNNLALKNLFASNTLIDTINLVVNSGLNVVVVDNNQNLSYLNVKNGNNTAIFMFDATTNPNLSCIEVDNVIWSNSNWTNKDFATVYSTDCSTVGLLENMKNKFEMLIYPNPTNGYVTIQLDEIPKNVVINIKDVLGKTLLEQKANSRSTLINVSSLPKGIYYVELINDSYKYAKKLVVQ